MGRALLLIPLAMSIAGSASAAERIEIVGNVALPTAVYQSAIILSDAARAKTATVADERTEQVARSVLDFLLASGYDLATVDATYAGDRIRVKVDEGRLDKIIFLRQGTLQTLELKLSIDLPGDIFNRPLLEQQLREVVRDTDVTKATFRVLQIERRDNSVKFPQVPGRRLLQGLDIIRPGAPHELHIYLERPDRKDGLRLQVGIASPDGLYVGLAVDEADVFLEGDRLDTATRAGFRLDSDIDTASNPVGLSRLALSTEWHTPKFGELVSSFLRLEANVWARLREDLGVANYYFLPVAASLNFEVAATERLKIAIGGGFEERLLFGVDAVEGETIADLVENTENTDLRFFIGGDVEWLIGEPQLRLDRQHKLTFEGRFLGKGSLSRSQVITKLAVAYDNVIPFGFDELHLGARGADIFGEPRFYDELSIGDGFLRAAFGNTIYFLRAAGTTVEYRLAISRDVLKISIFDDFAVYQDRIDRQEVFGIRAATTFGGGVHLLFLDAFQLNAYAGLGIAAGREVGFGIALSIKRAY